MTTVADGLYQYGGVPVGGITPMEMFAVKAGGNAESWSKQSVIRYVDGSNGSDSNTGFTPLKAKATIQSAVDSLPTGLGGIVYVYPKAWADAASDPSGYAESVTIANTKPGTSIIGISTGRTMGGQPMLRQGAGTAAHIILQAPGCTIKNLTINGASNTGGGIQLAESATNQCWGTTIENCYFKNCKGSAAASTGGAIFSTYGGCWQTLIRGCYFHNNRLGVGITASTVVAEAWTIEDCVFVANANTTVDADIYIYNCQSLAVRNCTHGTVDVPAYATSPTCARYIYLGSGTEGTIANCTFACTGKTIGAAGDACIVPTTTRIASCYQENAIFTRT